MRCFKWIAVAAVVAAGLGGFAQGQDGPVKVYKVGHDVTAPQLLPADFSSAIASDCGKTISSKVTLSFVVDAEGVPRNIMFVKPSDTDLDRLAVRVFSLERFLPAKKDGIPVAIGESLEMKLDGCLVDSEDSSGQKSTHLRLRKILGQKLADYEDFPATVVFAQDSALPSSSDGSTPSRPGGNISAPVPMIQPKAEYTVEARKKRIQGICLVRVIVNSNGLPEQPRVVRSLIPELDEKAIEAVNRYRFKPAMRGGVQPVPVMIAVEIIFRLV
jgi:TonB family protein